MKYVVLLFFLSTMAGVLHAHNGSLNGQIIDAETGLEIPGAVVKLEPGARFTSTNTLGFFYFTDLPAGEYTLSVQMLGYETLIKSGILIRDSETSVIRLDVKPAIVDLREVEVMQSINQPLQTISGFDIQTRPINTAQDVLRIVPGLFIAQHAGGGKAEQLFLRGFDIDHGTDVNLTVDGMPVNMVSHAHGQGYADLHFVIPELIEGVNFKKGPYDVESGNFTTAGQVRFKTADALGNNMVKLEAGQFNTYRAMGAFNILGNEAGRRNRHAYIAAENAYSDGYFNSSQQFNRLNLFGKYTALLDDDHRVSLSASAFQSSWNASGQIPERAVKSGQIDRFGAIDDTEGGLTNRYNINFEHQKAMPGGTLVKNQLYYVNYGFELYSNFTFFLNDPVNGDQIRQKERRRIFGYNGAIHTQGSLFGKKIIGEYGIFYRNDLVQDNELSRTANRSRVTQALAFGDVNESNTGAYFSETLVLGKFSLNAGLRYDAFLFAYENALDTLYKPEKAFDNTLNPKVNLYYDWSPALRLYLSAGNGFHANDTRVVVAQQARQTLPKASGVDLGAIFKPSPALLVHLAAWYLKLEQEFVYVGDEAVVEAGGRSVRQGLDLSARMQLFRYLYTDLDVTYSHARSVDEPEGARYIPLAPVYTATGGIGWDKGKGLFGSLRFRYLGDRPANEDNSVNASGYFLLDAVAGWKTRRVEIGLSVQNLGNVAWNEAQFDTESRLKNEAEPVSEIHYTPGTPFFVKGGITFRF